MARFVSHRGHVQHSTNSRALQANKTILLWKQKKDMTLLLYNLQFASFLSDWGHAHSFMSPCYEFH